MVSPSAARGSLTRGLVIATLVVLGLTGSLLDRALIATPAWERLGVMGWATYSRYADLGNGLIVYPIVGILPTVLAVAAAVSHRFDDVTNRSAGPPVYLTALSMIGVMVTTLIAAPVMLGVGVLADDPAGLQQAFDQFTLWGVYVRGSFFAIAFLSSVWALVVLGPRPATRTVQVSPEE